MSITQMLFFFLVLLDVKSNQTITKKTEVFLDK